MQNYRPFKEINPELLGAKLKSKDGNNLTSIISIDFNDKQYDLPYYTGADIWYNNDDLFNNFVFLDTGLPVGEEAEEVKTAIDFFYDNVKNYFVNNIELLEKIVNSAKLIERGEHGNTWNAAIMAHEERGHNISRSLIDFDDYKIR